MADFYALAVRLEDIPKEYFKLTQSANENYHRESAAAVKIQSAFRRWVVLIRYRAIIRSAYYVLRLAKGLLGRNQAKLVRAMKMQEENMLFFHHIASIIQKFWRGFRSRRKLHDFYKRRRYMDQVVARGDRTVEFLRRQYKDKLEKAKIEEEHATQKAFTELTSQIHHLVGTHRIAGVFNAPYAPQLPSAFGKPLEQHLRDNCHIAPIKSLLKPSTLIDAPKSARADFAGCQDTSTTMTTYPTPPSQAPPSQRTPRPPKVVQDGKVMPMKSPRAPQPAEGPLMRAPQPAPTSPQSLSSKVSPKAPTTLPTLSGSPRKIQTAR